MPEWLIERGIGETRAALLEDGEIVEARVELDGHARAGSVVAARLVTAAARNAVARDESGAEYLVPRGAAGVTEGASLNIEVTREAIPGGEGWKRPLARVTDEAPREAGAMSGQRLSLPAAHDALGAAGWNDLIEQARSGTVRFAGGELRISPTPAMTLIDVDGYFEPEELAALGAAEAARAIRRLDIGGSIGIDLPTIPGRVARQRAAAAVDALLPQPFERTAVNGFGFLQIVRPRLRASLVELAQDRVAFEARQLLRRAAFEAPGPKRIVAHAAIIQLLEQRPSWLEQLARQLGGAIGLRAELALPISAGHAEAA